MLALYIEGLAQEQTQNTSPKEKPWAKVFHWKFKQPRHFIKWFLPWTVWTFEESSFPSNWSWHNSA